MDTVELLVLIFVYPLPGDPFSSSSLLPHPALENNVLNDLARLDLTLVLDNLPTPVLYVQSLRYKYSAIRSRLDHCIRNVPE